MNILNYASCKVVTVILTLLYFADLSKAQIPDRLPQIIPPSPSAQQFQKYIDYPIGHFTGIPDINIPLYIIKEGDLTIPITLSYHASGTKPSDPNGFVGMGWTLNNGGRITRTIVGKADETNLVPVPFKSKYDLDIMTSDKRNILMDSWAQDNYDTEPDIFSYSFNNHSGKFVLGRDDNRTPLLLPYKPINISFHSGGLGPIIYDENGFKYEFVGTELADQGGVNTCWDVNKITSATDPNNYITFSSGSYLHEYTSNRTDYAIIDDIDDNDPIWKPCYGFDSEGYRMQKTQSEVLEHYGPDFGFNSTVNYTENVISKIKFRNGEIKFIPDASTGMLQRVEIYNKAGTILQTIEFEYSNRNLRYLLKQVGFYDADHHFINHYLFNYNRENGEVPGALSANTDYWGYYNGSMPTGNNAAGALMPAWTIQVNPASRGYVTLGQNGRKTDSTYMKMFVLNKITYPTGGYTTYDYECNKSIANFGNGNYFVGSDVGGLRVKTVTHYSAPGATPEVRNYEYMIPAMDFVPGNIEDYSYSIQGYFPEVNDPNYNYIASLDMPFRRRYIYSDPLFNICPHGSPVVYQQVAEYIGDGQQNAGKTVYSYDYSPAEKTTYESNGSTAYNEGSVIYKQYLKPFQDWTSGNLTGMTHYKNDNGNYSIVDEEDYDYTDILGDALSALKIDRYVEYASDSYNCGSLSANNLQTYDSYLGSRVNSAYNYGDYSITSGQHRLANKYTFKDGITTTINYQYDNPIHVQPTKETITTSKGDNIITVLKYPHDFAGSQPYTAMVNDQHKWTPIVEKLEYKNSTDNFLQSTKTDYSFWNSGHSTSTVTQQIYPQKVSTKKGAVSNDYVPRINYQGYDEKGNVRSVSKADGAPITYLWGYQKEYPIAQVTGADTSEVYYNNVEEKTDYPANYVMQDNARAHTGHYSARITNTDPAKEATYHSNTWLQIDQHNKSRKFRYSGWVYSDGPSIDLFLFMMKPGEQAYYSYVDNVSTNQTGHWVYLDKVFEVPADVVQLNLRVDNNGAANGGTNIWFDDLRICPADAQMTTYTYDPLVGTTSVTDAKGETLYYEYDSFQRLITIRDRYGNVKSHYEYNYAGH
ncbi:RHS repeat protein [Mucilaginibacter robiniae]|uniref:RHS repeat protein n=1 Tax=Mucilaginibacter robiniae TaxID=2728022 RepID=A0A7L5E0D3_9SPHI|nr:RHS repeat protein [Mucilaginibacter robiniae]QJD95749.1 RHS repeat protein [Mucilaginibacter robiniae]